MTATLSTHSEQALAALDMANRARIAAANYKRELRSWPSADAARDLAARLLAEAAPNAYVWQLLEAVPRIGRSVATRMLAKADVSTRARARRLTQRQRRVLAGELVAWASRPHRPNPGSRS